MFLKISLIVSLALPGAALHAQDNKSKSVFDARCDKEVRDYLNALEFIRNAAGPQISSRVAASYVDEKVVRDTQIKQGSCTAAQLIRDKTATSHG